MRHVADNLPVQLGPSGAPPSEQRQKHKVSHRARQLWDRLGDWYGTRFADQYGDEPSRDWCVIVDAANNDELVSVLMLVRQRHVTFPPTLPEFAALVKEVRSARLPGNGRKSNADLLTEFIVKHRTLTPAQMLSPAWTYLHRETPDGGYVCTAVEIASVDGAPGLRVTMEDMNAEQVEL